MKAWKHVHNIFTAVGATNANWVWCPNIALIKKLKDVRKFYPGNQYVDWTCLDGFNWGETSNSAGWQTFTHVFSSTYKEVESFASSKPMIIGETASDERGGSKAAWIRNALHVMPTNFPKIRGFVWFDEKSQGMKWPIESSKSSEQAFQQAIRPQLFRPNIYSHLAGPKIAPPTYAPPPFEPEPPKAKEPKRRRRDQRALGGATRRRASCSVEQRRGGALGGEGTQSVIVAGKPAELEVRPARGLPLVSLAGDFFAQRLVLGEGDDDPGAAVAEGFEVGFDPDPQRLRSAAEATAERPPGARHRIGGNRAEQSQDPRRLDLPLHEFRHQRLSIAREVRRASRCWGRSSTQRRAPALTRKAAATRGSATAVRKVQ